MAASNRGLKPYDDTPTTDTEPEVASAGNPTRIRFVKKRHGYRFNPSTGQLVRAVFDEPMTRSEIAWLRRHHH